MKKAGIPEVCRKCGYDLHVEVSHIRPIHSFGLQSRISEINDLTNMEYLCPNCHWEFENLQEQVENLPTQIV